MLINRGLSHSWILRFSILFNITLLFYFFTYYYDATYNYESGYSVTQAIYFTPAVQNATETATDIESRIGMHIKCHNRDFKPVSEKRGDFWVLKNYIRAEHGEIRCLESITYTTHADYTFLDNIVPLIERWEAPVSIAMHAPGNDFEPTLLSIKYVRQCLPKSALVRKYVTFHVYFHDQHIPKVVPKYNKALDVTINCTISPPYATTTADKLYKTQKKLHYPVNVGRNIARDAAMTHFILASDIELYPNPGLVAKFLDMQARYGQNEQRTAPRVYPFSLFEVESKATVPANKTELQEMLQTNQAIPFHSKVCMACHDLPKSNEWLKGVETNHLNVFHIGKREGKFQHWEPIYIGTQDDPRYDERLSWEGRSDKMTQGYVLCVLDYEFHILDNAFLVHKPGIKVVEKKVVQNKLVTQTNKLIKNVINSELQKMYGTKKGCTIM